ncbi:MAG: hypothetical protein R3F25_07760 [Gammaproteobacteria bacterium]|jgi:tetratricopeptide (TPR) repeat protein|nr:tetratricopeptide repeat protein [Xanthomonadales bacterium]
MKKIIFVTLVLASQLVFAGEELTGNPERTRENSGGITELVYKKFEKILEMIADNKYHEARVDLNQLMAKRLNEYEKANVEQYLGWIDAGEEKYADAIKHYQAALASDALPNLTHFSLMLQVASLQSALGQYQKTIDSLHEYYKVTDKIKDTTFAMEGNAYAQLNQYKKAIPLFIKAIALSDEPREQWMYMLYSLHMELSQFQEAANVLEKLIEINPNKRDYWIRLYSVYFNLKQDKKALATLVLADKNGLLDDEKNRLTLYKMYALMEVPYKAGQVLEDGLKKGIVKPSFKHWDSLGKVWYSAAEMDKALEAFDEASKLATDGKIDFQRANIYFEREDWKKAKQALREAIEKGGLTETQFGNTWLLLGMVESEIGNIPGAIDALKHAKNYKNARKNAIQWIDHLEKKYARQKAQQEREQILTDAVESTGG